MENTKIGNKEAIALLITITFNNLILSLTKSIIDHTSSSSLLNILYISIITIIFTCIICNLLNKFPTYDLIDISNYLGGKILKWIIGLLFIAYFIFFSGILLQIFSAFLQISYFPYTRIFFIITIFLLGVLFACNLKYNAVFRTSLIFLPILIISTIFLFMSNIKFYNIDKIFPIWGNGLNVTFLSGICNMFVFQALAYIFFMPPILKDSKEIKKISINAIVISSILVLICVSSILFMFENYTDTDELLPLYYATKYIQFGMFFQKLDSFFVLIWIISFINYLCITIKFSVKIFQKLTKIESSNIFIYIVTLLLLFASIWPKNDSISTFLADTVYKYAFFILIIAISFFILLLANIKKKFKKE